MLREEVEGVPISSQRRQAFVEGIGRVKIYTYTRRARVQGKRYKGTFVQFLRANERGIKAAENCEMLGPHSL